SVHCHVECAAGQGKVFPQIGDRRILDMRRARKLNLIHLHMLDERKGNPSIERALSANLGRGDAEVADEVKRVVIEHAENIRGCTRGLERNMSRRTFPTQFVIVEMAITYEDIALVFLSNDCGRYPGIETIPENPASPLKVLHGRQIAEVAHCLP